MQNFSEVSFGTIFAKNWDLKPRILFTIWNYHSLNMLYRLFNRIGNDDIKAPKGVYVNWLVVFLSFDIVGYLFSGFNVIGDIWVGIWTVSATEKFKTIDILFTFNAPLINTLGSYSVRPDVIRCTTPVRNDIYFSERLICWILSWQLFCICIGNYCFEVLYYLVSYIEYLQKIWGCYPKKTHKTGPEIVEPFPKLTIKYLDDVLPWMY